MQSAPDTLAPIQRNPSIWRAGFGSMAASMQAATVTGVAEEHVIAWAQAAHRQIVFLGEPIPEHLIAGAGVLDSLPPMYRVTGEGEWEFDGTAYTVLQAQQWTWREIQRCQSLVYMATNYCFTKNERLEQIAETGLPPGPEIIPDWGFVRGVLEQMDPPGQDLVIEKSRDMMLSWLCMTAVCHDLMMRRNWAVMTVSRVEDLVDDGGESCSVDSLHGKVRYMHEQMPAFLRMAAPLRFKHLRISCSATKSHCKGFSATPNAGRGPKWRRAVLDEFAFTENSQQVMTSVAPACPRGKIVNSTPNGKANEFYRLREKAQPIWPKRSDENKHWKLITVHWSQHPLRDEAWYRAYIDSNAMTDEAIAQELDICYDKSLSGRVYPKFVKAKHVAGDVLCPVSSVPYDPQRPLVVACDFNYDPLIWEIIQVHGSSETPFRVIDEICLRNAIIDDAVAELILRYGSNSAVENLKIERTDLTSDLASRRLAFAGPQGHMGPVLIYGDATEDASNVRSHVKAYTHIKTLCQKLAGWSVQLKVPPKNGPISTRLQTVNHALQHMRVVVSPRAKELRKDFESGVWNGTRTDMEQRKEDDDGSGLTRSHASSAFGYYMVKEYRGLGVAGGKAAASKAATAREMLANKDFVQRWIRKTN